jgi:hypothetical protein
MAKGDCPIVGVAPSPRATSAIGTLWTADSVFAWQVGFRAHCSKRRRVSRRDFSDSSDRTVSLDGKRMIQKVSDGAQILRTLTYPVSAP